MKFIYKKVNRLFVLFFFFFNETILSFVLNKLSEISNVASPIRLSFFLSRSLITFFYSFFPPTSPLHIAATNGHPDIMNLLISSGTHFDSTNAFQQTACDLLDEKELSRNIIQPINHTTLQCLAARAIIKHSLEYRGNIPEKLEAFVLLHR